ncbi:MAG: DUF4410 domain-containing protein [Geminicoccaceae bacterium]
MRRTRRRLIAGLVLAGGLAGCSWLPDFGGGGGEAAPGPLPRPQLVIVQRFATVPDEVRTDPGMSPGLVARLGVRAAAAANADEARDAQAFADALADALVLQIADLGIRAERGAILPAGTASGLIVAGQLLSADGGGTPAIGLGGGRGSVTVLAQVYAAGDGVPERLVEEIEVDARTGLAPLAGGSEPQRTLAATSPGAALTLLTPEFGDSVAADAERAAGGIARRLAARLGPAPGG